MKKLAVLLSLLLASSMAWSAPASGTLSSVSVSWEPTLLTYRYYATLHGSSTRYFLEVKDGRTQAVVDAQYALLLTAYSKGDTVRFETDYQGGGQARIRDIKVSQ